MKDELSILTLGAAKAAGGGGGGGGTSNYNALENKPQINGTTLSGNKTGADLGLASSTDIPTKTSDLTNDSNFIADASYVHTDNNYDATAKGIVDGVTAALAEKADASDVPTKTSDLTNDSGFIANTVNNLVNYYLKSETYTKSEVDAIVGAISTLHFEAVSVLPSENIQTNVIYLVPKSTAQTDNVKDEYINLDGTSYGWELIGSTEIDLSNYVTTTALNTALADYVTSTALATTLTSYVQKSQTAGLLKNDGTVDTNSYAQTSQLPSVATASAVGLVKPDGSSITVDANGVITAVGGSSGVSDVSWDSTNKKLKQTKNGTTSDIVTGETILNGLTSSQVTNALGYTPPQQDTNTHRPIQVNNVEVLGNNVTALNLKAGTNVSLSNNGGEVTISASGDTIVKTRYSVSYSMWSSSPNADGYYTRTITLNPTINTDVAPNVYLTGSGSTPHPDDTMKQMYSYVERCYLSGSTLTLYAKTKPTATFYIYVEGVAGSGSGSIVGNVIQPNGSGGGSNPFDTKDIIYTKQWTVSDFSGGTFTSFTLSSADNIAIRNCKTLLITLAYGNPELTNRNIMDSLVVDMSPVASGKRVNSRVEGDTLSLDTTKKGTMRAQLSIVDYENSTILDVTTTTDYINDQWSSGHKWEITVYKLA